MAPIALVLSGASLALAGSPSWQPLPTDIDTVAVGSCAHSAAPTQPVWAAVREAEPDVLLLLGDNVYADTEDPERLAKALRRLGRRPRFRRLTREVPVLATWDDHDFGPNDSDGRHARKDEVRQVTLDFFGAAADDPRRTRPDGLYGAWTLGSKGRRVQVVLLDTRYDLSPRAPRTDGGVGRYAPGPGQVLGDAQWAWLEEVLEEPAELRIIGSSIPFATEYTGWETWSNFPDEQLRMLEMLRDVGPVLVVSGDVHYGELSALAGVTDLTSSGLRTRPYPRLPNRHRIDDLVYDDEHFALVSIDWGASEVQLSWHTPRGEVAMTTTMRFTDLTPPVARTETEPPPAPPPAD